jgi:GTP-binding protein
VVAIVGRPNVGKSTFFNRVIGERQAIVEDQPGTTRDRLYGQTEWNGLAFTLVDTGGIQLTTVGENRTAGLVDQIRQQADLAVGEADVILFMVDARDGLTSADEMLAGRLRRSSKPVLLAVNKAESEQRRLTGHEFHRLGLGEPMPLSAFHGTGTGDLLDRLVELLPASPAGEAEDDSVKVAIVGRPNVGKSLLLNTLLGQERSIVSDRPGTTRDAIDTAVVWAEQPVTLIDTAGIRRRGRVEPGIEHYSVIRSLRAIDRCDVALLVIDGAEGLTAQDTHVAGYVQEEYKGVVLIVNKWDLVAKETQTMQRYTERLERDLGWLARPPIVFISALTGQRVRQIPALALQVAAERAKRVPTGPLNKLLQTAVADHPPPARPGRRLKFFYATQPAVEPPTFVFYVNDPVAVHFSYRRYLENCLRRAYGFAGVPLRLSFRERGGDEAEGRSR